MSDAGSGVGGGGGHGNAVAGGAPGAGAGAGQGGSSPSTGGAAGNGSLGGAAGGAVSGADSGGQTSGVPLNWFTVDGVDYSKIPGPNFETVKLMFDAGRCSGSNCHIGGRNHFQAQKSADDLYRYMMSLTTLKCGKLIDTANPSESAIVKYLRGPCGGTERMPYFQCFDDGDEWCVPEYYIQAIEQWIADGAPR